MVAVVIHGAENACYASDPVRAALQNALLDLRDHVLDRHLLRLPITPSQPYWLDLSCGCWVARCHEHPRILISQHSLRILGCQLA